MEDAGRTAARIAADDQDLAALRWDWGDAYEIGYDEHGWRARRRDGLGVLAAAAPDELYKVIAADYHARSVPRNYSAPLEDW